MVVGGIMGVVGGTTLGVCGLYTVFYLLFTRTGTTLHTDRVRRMAARSRAHWKEIEPPAELYEMMLASRLRLWQLIGRVLPWVGALAVAMVALDRLLG